MKYVIFPQDATWAQELHELVEDAEDIEYTPEELRESIISVLVQEELPTDVDYVRVMSLHKSKGLSAKVVVIGGCIQGLIPRQFHPAPEIEENEEIAEQEHAREQRRLFYVGITRSMERLLLSSSVMFPRDKAMKHGIPFARRGGTAEMGIAIATGYLVELGPKCPPSVSGNRLLESLR